MSGGWDSRNRSENFKLLCLWEGEGTASGASAAYKDAGLPLAARRNGSFWVERSPVPTGCRLLFPMDRDSTPDADYFISCDWTCEGYLRPSGNTRGRCFRQWPTVQLQSVHKFLRKLRFHPSYQQSAASPGKRWSWACHADGEEAAEESRRSLLALLNYRATPLQHGSSPAELLMGRKLRTRVPTLPTQHVPDGRDMSKFQETDACLRLWQKIDYDRRHKVRPLPQLTDGQPVWVKTPRDAEAVVVGTSSTTSTRSYNVRTERGIQRRDRYHLRRRDQQSSSGYDGVPKQTSTTIPSQSSQQTDQCDNQSDVQPDIQPQVANDGCAQRATVYTRSGRRVKIPERLNL